METQLALCDISSRSLNGIPRVLVIIWSKVTILTLILLTWRIWWAPNNASKWQMGFNLAFKGLRTIGIKQTKVKMLSSKPEVQKYFYFQRAEVTIAFVFQLWMQVPYYSYYKRTNEHYECKKQTRWSSSYFSAFHHCCLLPLLRCSFSVSLTFHSCLSLQQWDVSVVPSPCSSCII